MNILRTLSIIIFLLPALVIGKDSIIKRFNHTKIISIPDLSFLDEVYTGLDILEQMDFKLLKNKTIAILTNQTAINKNGMHLLDIIRDQKDIKISFLLAFEHGVWGIDDNRSKMISRDKIEPVHGAMVIDLFNTYLYPPRWVMDKIDLILVDFQETGSRYSTFLATMTKVFESASNHNVPVLILDRPNPIRGDVVDGPVPRTEFQSFESYHLLPIRHGLTIGEIALIINEMGWVNNSKRIDLSILPLSNWDRDMWFENTSLIWRNPLPYIRDPISLLVYGGMYLFKGTNMNIGFGTKTPYMLVGAPWLETSFLMKKLAAFNLPGVIFKDVKYRPNGSVYHSIAPKYDGKSCSGIKIEVIDKNIYDPIRTAITMMILIQKLHPHQFKWADNDYIDKLYGTNDLRIISAQGKSSENLPAIWARDVYEFSEFRSKFLMY